MKFISTTQGQARSFNPGKLLSNLKENWKGVIPLISSNHIVVHRRHPLASHILLQVANHVFRIFYALNFT